MQQMVKTRVPLKLSALLYCCVAYAVVIMQCCIKGSYTPRLHYNNSIYLVGKSILDRNIFSVV